MPRVKGGTISRARHKKVLKQAKGYFGSKHRLYRTANEQVMHSLKYAYRDRKQNKREFRKLWITRINAACRENGMSYSKFINGLSKAGVVINRKMLSEIAIDNKEAFQELVKVAQDGLDGKVVADAKTSKPAVKKTTKEAPMKKEEVKPSLETTDLSKLKVAELRDLAKEKGIEGYTTMKKAELLDALK